MPNSRPSKNWPLKGSGWRNLRRPAQPIDRDQVATPRDLSLSTSEAPRRWIN